MPQRDRQRKPARPEAFKDSKPTILVVSEGAVTEPEYLSGFKAACRNPRVDIEALGGQGVPRSVVEAAREAKTKNAALARRHEDENLRYDEVWCVFDVDDHPDVNNAKEMARNNGIKVAISNPCIELWLYLHFAEQPGAQGRDRVTSMLKEHLDGFDKHVKFEVFAIGYEHAAKRARRLDEEADAAKESGRNPTTGFWKLTRSIEESA